MEGIKPPSEAAANKFPLTTRQRPKHQETNMAERNRGADHGEEEEEEEDDSSEEDQDDNDEMEHDDEEFLPDIDNDGARHDAASSSSLNYTAIFMILLLVSGIVIQLGAVVESWRPPSEAPKRQLEEQEEKEWRASLLSAGSSSSSLSSSSPSSLDTTLSSTATTSQALLQTFYLILSPTVSGTDGRQYEFGSQTREDQHLFTLGALERRKIKPEQQGGFSSDQEIYSTTTTLEEASVPLAKAWIESNGRAIFQEIGNFGPMGTELDFYGHVIVKFVAVQQYHPQRGKLDHRRHGHSRTNNNDDDDESPNAAKEDDDKAGHEIWYAFQFREVQAGLATLAFLRQLQDEVRTGGDTWACGDFGDVTEAIAAQSGFGPLWRNVLSSVTTATTNTATTTVNPEKVQFRVHLEDPKAYVISRNGQPLPEPPSLACTSFQYKRFSKPQQPLPFW
jgi:hypothetical protein